MYLLKDIFLIQSRLRRDLQKYNILEFKIKCTKWCAYSVSVTEFNFTYQSNKTESERADGGTHRVGGRGAKLFVYQSDQATTLGVNPAAVDVK